LKNSRARVNGGEIPREPAKALPLNLLANMPLFFHKERSDIMEKNKKVRFTTTIDEELLKRIKIKAIEEGKNVNEIIEKLLQEYLKR